MSWWPHRKPSQESIADYSEDSMSHYAIGDIQGCYTEFRQLLNQIAFDDRKDILWLAGDIINGGPDNLSLMRFLKELPQKPIMVLGNHDLHALAVFHGIRTFQSDDTFSDLLEAPDADELFYWLQSQPLAHYDASLNALMIHAGVNPHWSLDETLCYAKEIEIQLDTPEKNHDFFMTIFGTQSSPEQNRMRLLVDTFTRIRFCNHQGDLNLSYKGTVKAAPDNLVPWFECQTKNPPIWASCDVLFGHWAALEGKINQKKHPHLFALDTGCVWGGHLSALRLEDKQWFRVNGRKYR